MISSDQINNYLRKSRQRAQIALEARPSSRPMMAASAVVLMISFIQ